MVHPVPPNIGPLPTADPVVLPPSHPPAGPVSAESSVAPADTPQRSTPPQAAFRAGMMPLGSTGVPQFALAHPTFDGRGVLIAILDSGIDPSAPGLQTTSTGLPKLIDLRDFSGEGRIDLRPISRRGDTLRVGGLRLLGASRVAALADGALLWGGIAEERPFGEAPAADFDGNGTVGDSLPIVVVKSGSGWMLFTDTQRNGTLADDRPVRDFAVARESFGWSSTNQSPPLSFAVQFADSAGGPLLDLFFDTSSHGTHVAGIAAGHDLYGVPGFDGVAPGARVLGLKIANDARGAVTVTGSMVRALDYAIRFAQERQLPLVVNLSFGVGNEVEGRARVDAQIDSVLEAHPDVVMTVAAGNDGPGLSTIGFPGSASRVLSIGATEPAEFTEHDLSGGDVAESLVAELVASFSSRGGELAGPDLVVPGTAYSSVPNFAIGDEQQSGTSMASPHAAGLAARLLSGMVSVGRTPPAASIAQALRASAHLPVEATASDAGAGIPNLEASWRWLAQVGVVPVLDVGVGELHARGAVFLTAHSPGAGAAPLVARVSVWRRDALTALQLTLHTTASWVHLPTTIPLVGGHAEFVVKVDVAGMPAGVHAATIMLRASDTALGVLARVPVVLRVPMAAVTRVESQTIRVEAGGIGRVIIPAESGRGIQVEVATTLADGRVTASLHEPGGMPFRDGATLLAGSGDGAALFDIGANDVESGTYELDVMSGPLAASSATVTVRRAPVILDAVQQRDSLRISARNIVGAPLSLRLRAGLVGAEQRFAIHRTDGAIARMVVAVPSWATRIQVDSRMPRAEWARFTDFGVTFLDRAGRHLATSPLDYAFGRAAPELPARLAGDSIVILLSPAFASEGPAPWELDLTVRFYAEDVVGLDDGGSPAQSVASGKLLEQQFFMRASPLEIPRGFVPVIIVLAREGEDTIWMRELALQGGTAP